MKKNNIFKEMKDGIKKTFLSLAKEHRANCKNANCEVSLFSLIFLCNELKIELNDDERDTFYVGYALPWKGHRDRPIIHDGMPSGKLFYAKDSR